MPDVNDHNKGNQEALHLILNISRGGVNRYIRLLIPHTGSDRPWIIRLDNSGVNKYTSVNVAAWSHDKAEV